jgi:hypothetical protein
MSGVGETLKAIGAAMSSESSGPSLDAALLPDPKASEALARLEARASESAEEWADRLAPDLVASATAEDHPPGPKADGAGAHDALIERLLKLSSTFDETAAQWDAAPTDDEDPGRAASIRRAADDIRRAADAIAKLTARLAAAEGLDPEEGPQLGRLNDAGKLVRRDGE